MGCGSLALYALLLLELGKFLLDCSLNVVCRFVWVHPSPGMYIIFSFPIKGSVITTECSVTDVGIINRLSALCEWLRHYFSLLPNTDTMFCVSLCCKLSSWYQFPFIPTLHFIQAPIIVRYDVYDPSFIPLSPHLFLTSFPCYSCNCEFLFVFRWKLVWIYIYQVCHPVFNLLSLLLLHFCVLHIFSFWEKTALNFCTFLLCVNVTVRITQLMAHFSSESILLLLQMCSKIGEALCLAVHFTLTWT